MDSSLKELIRISNLTGKDSTLVQGGGGNTSVKTADGKFMYIKASGTALKDMNEKKGWRRMRLSAVTEIIRDRSLAKLNVNIRETEVVNRLLLACDDNIKNARPSVEAHLHASLDEYVIHLHPLAIAAYVSAKNGKEKIEKLFKNEKYPPLWVPYVDPGFMLAKKISQLVEKYEEQYRRKPALMILEKHGIFVTAKTADKALRIVRKTIKTVSVSLKIIKPVKLKKPQIENIRKAKCAVRKALFDATGKYLPVRYYEPAVSTIAFMKKVNAAKLLATPALNPDELVYANGSAMWIEDINPAKITKKLNRLINKKQKTSAAFVVKGLGIFTAAENKKTSDIIAEITEGSLLIRMYAESSGGVLPLTSREQNFINQWESEAFRKQLAGAAGAGTLKNRISIVTGAGSGLGRSIAIGMARSGAIVGLADIDTKAAAQTHEIISQELPGAQTLVLSCNVTDEKSVNDGFDKMAENFGGVDIIVNAAGVAPAYPLVDLPVDKWRFALEVNLTGYFLTAKAAARMFIEQGIGGSIINISSKSGLDASKNNTPYNATKAGELHMARGWALELGQYGIRVNCVCPGNVFEGSKIWNPAYIKQCAKKYGIKPEEVIPYYVGKTTLQKEIKGQDIADSVVFLCSDKARTITGQTIVADCGQVMVR